MLYGTDDEFRFVNVPEKEGDGRSAFRRDWSRLIHCSSFRRLQGKMQLFPVDENDYFRNRLTHSLEVSQIASGLVVDLNRYHPYFSRSADNHISEDVAIFAALAHDLGHPPFGHNGERKLNSLMAGFGGFEGNAQSFRIVTRIQKKETEAFPLESDLPTFSIGPGDHDTRIGLNITVRGLASILKYDKKIPQSTNGPSPTVKKGYYASEAPLVRTIKAKIAGDPDAKRFRTVECSLMELADDIAYSTYDLEDAFKAGFCSPIAIIALPDEAKLRIVDEVNDKMTRAYPAPERMPELLTLDEFNAILLRAFREIIDVGDANIDGESVRFGDDIHNLAEFGAISSTRSFSRSKALCDDAYLRTDFTSKLVREFMSGVDVDVNEARPALCGVYLKPDVFKAVEILKRITHEFIIRWYRLRMAERRGTDIIGTIFGALENEDGGRELLPEDWQRVYFASDETIHRRRTVCDFIAGMTDRYCVEFYRRLVGPEGPSLSKAY